MKVYFLIIVVSSLITTDCFSQTTVQKKQTLINPVLRKSTTTKLSGSTGKAQSSSNQKAINKVDSAEATLLDASFSVSTARSYIQDPGTNKAADTHWSCVLFDQNDRQVTSFNDNSNTDEYISGSETPLLEMHSDNTALFGVFSKGGRLHLSVSPNGNDTWEISGFDLTLDFRGPAFTQKLRWSGIKLSQDKKDIDLFFHRQKNNLAPQ